MFLVTFSIVMSCWLGFRAVSLFFKVAWGPKKIAAAVLTVLAAVTLVIGVIKGGGFMAVLPMILLAVAWILLEMCVDT